MAALTPESLLRRLLRDLREQVFLSLLMPLDLLFLLRRLLLMGQLMFTHPTAGSPGSDLISLELWLLLVGPLMWFLRLCLMFLLLLVAVSYMVDPQVPTVLCGDFNAVFNRPLDRRGSNVFDASRESFRALASLFSDCCVVDVWSQLHPGVFASTWMPLFLASLCFLV